MDENDLCRISICILIITVNLQQSMHIDKDFVLFFPVTSLKDCFCCDSPLKFKYTIGREAFVKIKMDAWICITAHWLMLTVLSHRSEFFPYSKQFEVNIV